MTQYKPRGGGALIGFGGGKGGGGGRVAEEAPDSLHSTQYARILDLISVGPTGGPFSGDTFGLRDIFLNGTPIQNEDGSINFPGVEVHYRLGTQNQDPIPGFPAAENTIAVGTELKYGTPWAQQITNSDLSAVRITLGSDRLTTQDTKNGDLDGGQIEYVIELSTDGGAFAEVQRAAMVGKTTNRYTRTHRVDLPPRSTYWTVRVRRLTPDSTSSAVASRSYIDAITEVVDEKLRYPMMGIVGYLIPAHLFSSIPTRAVRWKGREIRIPSNYDPFTRSYAGTWDGTFKTAVCSNPAWVLLDIWTNDIFGLGHRVDLSMIDRYALYRIAQYCDELVPDGLGGMEPRFRIVGQLRTRADARKLLQDMASVFHGMSYELGGVISTVADMPQDPIFTYSAANVVGDFNYTGTNRSTRFTVALVSYSNQDDFGRQKVEAVEDYEGIARYGVRETQVSTFLNVSRGQAVRMGKWVLLTSKLQTRGVNFTVGLDYAVAAPGRIVEIADNMLAGAAIGGRVFAAVSESEIVLDRVARIKVGDTLKLNLPAGVCEERTVATVEVEEERTRIRVSTPYSEFPQAEAGWNVSSSDLKPQQFRILNVRRKETILAEITAVEALPGKHVAIDYGTKLDPLPTTVVPSLVMAPPTEVTISAHSAVDQHRAVHVLRIEWKGSKDAKYYQIQWRRNNGNWVAVADSAELSVEIEGIRAGAYQARVRAVSALDVRSLWVSSESKQLEGDLDPPPAVSMLMTQSLLYAIRVTWGFPAGSTSPIHHTELWIASEASAPMSKLTDVPWPQTTYELSGLPAGASVWFWARGVDSLGEPGPFYPAEDQVGVVGTVSTNADDYLDAIRDKVVSSELGQQLLDEVRDINISIDGIDESIADVRSNVSTVISDIADINLNINNILAEVGGNEGALSEIRRDAEDLRSDLLKEAATRADALADAVQRILDEAAARVAQGEQISQDLLNEVAARTAQYSQLIQDIADEAAARAAAVQGVADSVSAEAAARAAAIISATDVLDARIDALNSDIASILGAEEYSASSTYSEGNLVTYQGKLYRAKGTTTGHAPTDTTYWEKIGNYDSIGAAVSDLASRVVNVETVQADHATKLTSISVWQDSAEVSLTYLGQASATQASQLSSLTVRTDDAESNITSLQQTDADQAEAINSLTVKTGNLTNRITTVETATDALAQRTSSLESASAEAASRITTAEEVAQSHALQLINLQATVGDADGEITEIRKVSADHAQILSELKVSNGAASSRIQQLEDVQADQASRLTTVESSAADSAAKVIQLTETTVSQASTLSELKVTTESHTSQISTLYSVTESQATWNNNIAVAVNDHQGRIQSLETVSADSASRVQTLEVTSGEHTSKIAALDEATASHATQIAGISTKADHNEAAIASEASTRADADTALSRRVDTLTAKSGDLEAGIVYEITARTDADTALATELNNLAVRVGGNEGAITSEATARADADSALTRRVDTLTTKVGDNSSAIATEQTTRADADSALSTRIDAVTATANGNTAAIATEQSTRADADSALASRLTTIEVELGSGQGGSRLTALEEVTQNHALQLLNLQATVGDADGEITEIRKVSADQAILIRTLQVTTAEAQSRISTVEDVVADQASQISTIESKADANEAAIVAEATTRANADSAMASQISGLASRVGSAESAIQSEATTRANADSAMSTQISGLAARVGSAESAIQSEATTRADGDSALSSRIDTMLTAVNANKAAIQTEQSTRADADSALSRRIDTLTTTVSGNTSAIQTEQQARASADSALASRVQTLEASVVDGNMTGRLQTVEEVTQNHALQLINLQATVGDADGELTEMRQVSAEQATFIRILQVQAGDAAAALKTEETARISADSALGSRIDSVITRVGDNEAAIQSEQTARAAADSALSTRIDTVQATTGDNTAAIQTEAEARADLEGNLSAMYTMKTQVSAGGKRYAAGIGLGVENDPNGPGFISQILMQADRFALINVSADTTTTPFVVQNGQTFINQALIGEAWIKDGHIESLDGIKIWADTIRGEQIDAHSVASKMFTTDVAYIKTANIGVAQVDTLRLAGGAVTTATGGDFNMEFGQSSSNNIYVMSFYTADWANAVFFIEYSVWNNFAASADVAVELYQDGQRIYRRRIPVTGSQPDYPEGVTLVSMGLAGGWHTMELKFDRPPGSSRRAQGKLVALGFVR